MRYIALEEAFSIPGLDDRQPSPWLGLPLSQRHLADWARKLPDFTEYRLPEMDAAGIDVQVLSLTVPGLQADADPAIARDDARFANDYLAQVIAEHPDRFRGFAALPMQNPSAAAAELARCVHELGFCGALVNDHLQGHYLDEPQYDEVWAALEELSVPLYLHPGAPPADRWKVLDGRPELYGATWSWAAEVGGHALRIIYGGVFDRHPGATLILGHMGELLPFMLTRTNNVLRGSPTLPDVGAKMELSLADYVHRNIHISISGFFTDPPLRCALDTIGADRIMFAVDHPFGDDAAGRRFLDEAAITDEEREKIAHLNAERLLRIGSPRSAG